MPGFFYGLTLFGYIALLYCYIVVLRVVILLYCYTKSCCIVVAFFFIARYSQASPASQASSASLLLFSQPCSSPPRQASPAIQPISQSCQPCYPKPCLTSLAGALGLAGLLFLPGCRHGWLWLPGFSFALWLLSGGKFPPGPPLKKKIFCSESLVGLSFSCTAKPAMFLLQYTSVP